MKITSVIQLFIAVIMTSQIAFADGEYANKTPKASAQLEGAEGETLASAVGYYARARSLLIEAVREFDRGAKIARPDAILDSEEWRNTLISRAEDLETILAPQARVTKGGVKFGADNRLLNVTGK